MNKKMAKTILPKLRFLGFKNEPAWQEDYLGKMGEFTGGGTPSKSNDSYWKGNIPWVSSSDVSEDSIHELKISRYITKKAIKESATKLVPENSILLVSRVGVGKLAISKKSVCTSQDFTNFTPKKDNLTFLAYYIKSISKTLLEYSQGMAIKGFTKEDVSKLQLFLPKPAEQQKISDCLSSVDELIAAQTQKIDALKAHKKGLMQQFFPAEGETVPKLRFPKYQDAGGWSCRILGGFISERCQLPEGRVPLYSLTIEDGIAPKTERYERSFLVKNEDKAYKLVQPGDFAYNPMNLRFGAIARHSGEENVAVSKYYNIFYCDDSVDSRFCEIYFRSPGMIAYYDDVATGSLIEKRRVHFSDFLKFEIRFPSLDEQKKIADCLSSIDDLITVQAHKIDALKAHKKGLVQQLFPSPKEMN
ncbi:MAG: restriction endonuclease subunit S [Chromatiales bacterium]|jgi:type I restriction enzyme S subunit